MSEQKRYTVTDLYHELSKIYSCKYSDNLEEMKAAISALEDEIIANKTPREVFVNKMIQLKKVTNDFQSKLSSHILTKYWEKQFSAPVEFRAFKHETDEDDE